MKRNAVLTVALFATLHAQADYLFVNVTGNLREGYPVEVQDKDGKSIRTIENNQTASIQEMPSYQIIAHKSSGKQKARTLAINPIKGSTKKVIVIDVRNLTNRLVSRQMTLEEAKSKYGKRVAF